MQATATPLVQLFGGYQQFTMPIFQRPYSWRTDHCKTLFEDIIRIGHTPNPSQHFIGSVVYLPQGMNTTGLIQYRVIDGQQRLTTVTLLVAALVGFYRNQDNQNRVNLNNLGFNEQYLINNYLLNAGLNPTQYKLTLTGSDSYDLICLLNNIITNVPYIGNGQSNIKINYDNFGGWITIQNVIHIYKGLTDLHIVNVMLDNNDNPQLIFESLNSTGLDLTQADLIRNFVLMGQQAANQILLYNNYWLPMESSFGNHYEKSFNSFVRDYLTVETGYISKINAVYKDFKHYAHGKGTQQLVINIYKYSTYYINIALDQEPDPNLKNAFKRISQLDVRACYPFLLKVYDDYSADVINAGDFDTIVCLVENYIFRRTICGLPSNSLNKIFADLYGQADPINGTNYLQSIKNAFSVLKDNKRFPDDTEFETCFITIPVYNLSSCRYMLERLEKHGNQIYGNTTNCSIEHIMPQTLNSGWQQMLGANWKNDHDKYIHNIGNLTLTGTSANAALGNISFSNKQAFIPDGFDRSPFRLTYDYFSLRSSHIQNWNATYIEQRANILSKRALTIWFGP